MSIDSVNDDYCDCADGSDEPGTSACGTGVFFCNNVDHSRLLLPSSRVTDSICDCCDGSDEYNLHTKTSPCQNTCREAAREARKGLRIQISKYEAGLQLKESFLTSFVEKIQQEKVKKASLEAEKQKLDTQEKVQVQQKDELQAKRDAKAASLKDEIAAIVEKELLEQEAKAAEEAKKQAEQPQEPQQAEDTQHPHEHDHDHHDHDHDHDHDHHDHDHHDHDHHHEEQPAEAASSEPNQPTGPTPAEEREKQREKLTKEKLDAHPEISAIQEEITRADEDLILVRDEIKTKDSSLRDIDNFLSTDFGEGMKWAYLHDRTISTRSGEYTYELHAFKEVRQVGGGTHNLGRWKGWEGNVMKYEGGDKCWGGPDRSMRATVLCGGEDKILDVKEPAKCEYHMVLETPAGCSREDYEKLKVQLASD